MGEHISIIEWANALVPPTPFPGRLCKVKQAACAFESWLAQHRSCNGDQVCSNCWQCPIPRGSISKAVQRVAATQAKVARTAAEEKKGRAIADVWEAIAE